MILIHNLIHFSLLLISDENDCKCKDQKYLDLFSTLAICDWNQERNVDPDVLPMEVSNKK